MELVKQLRQLIGEDRVTDNRTILERHSKDESYHEARLPDAVVFPETTEEVSKVVKFANEEGIPVVPFGIGSSLEGHVIPLKGGISIDFERMNRVLEVRPGDFLVKVQPGVTRTQLNLELKKYGLFFPVDPGADATIGGMASTNASGTTSVRYGIMRNQVRDLEVVLASGEVIHSGGLAEKSSSGYNLNHLFIGSEGTLGIFTEITLRVYGIPEVVMAARAVFETVEQTVKAAVDLLSAGIPIARVELVDARSVKQVNHHSETDYPEKPTLFLEFHGNEAGLNQDVAFARELIKDEGGLAFEAETDSKRRAKLWEARHHLAYAFIHGFPEKKMMLTDVCLPLTELTGAICHARVAIDASGLDGAVLGHVGDGNFHSILMYNPNQAEDLARANEVNEKIVAYSLERGGTCTGEHGVGFGKSKYQRREHGAALDVMKSIKQTLDPKGILNPGKIF
ncbi:MAG TPA: FAD-linked oxidase C-terminal domain-containing protein [Bacillales bacterium]|nr:FAD-linked oxidase C-terminal domain-containing protein [Bacillales bacterium]